MIGQVLESSTKWDKRFMDLAEHVASWSRDPSTKVGAVIIEPGTKLIRGLGYNGFPRGVFDLEERYNTREVKYEYVAHAEVNAILNCTLRPQNCSIYCTLAPCNECAKLIIQAGIKNVYSWADNIPSRWKASTDTAKSMFNEAEVQVIAVRQKEV